MSRTYRRIRREGKWGTRRAVVIEAPERHYSTVTVPDGMVRTPLRGLKDSGVGQFREGECMTPRERKIVKSTIRRGRRRMEKAVMELEHRAAEAELREERALRNARRIDEEMHGKALARCLLQLVDAGKHAPLMDALKAHLAPKDLIKEDANRA